MISRESRTWVPAPAMGGAVALFLATALVPACARRESASVGASQGAATHTAASSRVIATATPTDAAVPRAVAAPLPAVDPSALWASLYAANLRVDQADLQEGELPPCGGSGGYACWSAVFARRQQGILAIARTLRGLSPTLDDAAACALRLELRRQLAVLANGRDQAVFADTSQPDGYCHCALPPVALPPELDRLTQALATRCPAPASPCTVTVPASFHLRDTETVASVGRSLPSGTEVEVLAAQTLHRAAEGMYLVALRSDGATGYTFLPTALIPAACHLPVVADDTAAVPAHGPDTAATEIAALIVALDHAVHTHDEDFLRTHLAFPVRVTTQHQGVDSTETDRAPGTATAFLHVHGWLVPRSFVARCAVGEPHTGGLHCEGEDTQDRDDHFVRGPRAITVQNDLATVTLDAPQCGAGEYGVAMQFVRSPDGWRLSRIEQQ